VVGAFAEHLLGQRKRARLLGSNGLSDTTIEHRLADIAAFGALLGERGIDDWAAVSAGDVDAFLVANMNSRVASLRAFFAFAKQRKVVLVDPTAGVDHRSPKGFSGRVLLRSEQRELLGRWARPDVNANERAAGLLSLLHGAGSYELRHLLAEDIDLDRSRVVLGRRRFAVPVDPITVAALRACLAARESLVTENPHLIITKDSRMHTRPCSQYYVFHLFDDLGVSPQVLRQTRLVHVAHRADPRVLAIAFGLTEGGALHYMADSVDHEELAFGAKP
jgi:site-specific recombinase XerD